MNETSEYFVAFNAQHPRGKKCETQKQAENYMQGWLRSWVEDAAGNVVAGQRVPFNPDR
jgi:hypothetical protein